MSARFGIKSIFLRIDNHTKSLITEFKGEIILLTN